MVKSKIWLLKETKVIDEYDTKEEAEAEKDNCGMFFPENSYEVVEQIIDLDENENNLIDKSNEV